MNNKKRMNQKNTSNKQAIGILRKFHELEGDIDALFEVANTLLKEKELSKMDSQKVKESMQYFLDSMFEKSPHLILESYFRNSYKNFQGKDTE